MSPKTTRRNRAAGLKFPSPQAFQVYPRHRSRGVGYDRARKGFHILRSGSIPALGYSIIHTVFRSFVDNGGVEFSCHIIRFRSSTLQESVAKWNFFINCSIRCKRDIAGVEPALRSFAKVFDIILSIRRETERYGHERRKHLGTKGNGGCNNSALRLASKERQTGYAPRTSAL